MFVDLNANKYLDTIKELIDAETHTLISQYEKVHKIIFQYCIANNIIISDPEILVDNNVSRRRIGYYLYATNPFKHAINLSNELVKISKFVEMKTQITHKEFVICVNLLTFVNFYEIPYVKERKEKSSFIKTSTCIIYNMKLQFMPPDVELINIYRKLYTASCVSEWKSTLKLEKNIFDLHKKRIDYFEMKPYRIFEPIKITDIKKEIFKTWCTDKIIIGYWAYYLYVINSKDIPEYKFNYMERLQLISQNSIENDFLSLTTLIKNQFACQISYKKQNINIPKDFRIEKYCITVIDNDKIYTILELYNSSTFEIIPYIQLDNYMVGNPFVLLRFFLIDYWIIKYITAIGKLPSKICYLLLDKIMKHINVLRSDSMVQYLFGKKYTGLYVDEIIADKLRRLDTVRHMIYLPHVKKREY